MPRPPKKKTRIIAKAKREGELKAETEHEYKSVKWLADLIPFLPEKYKKNAVLWMKSIFEKNMGSIPKAVAILGMTYIVKRLIDTTEELAVKVTTLKKETPLWYKIISQPILYGMLELVPERTEETKEGVFPDWADWLIAYTIAYIIIEHGGQIALGLGEGLKGLTGLVGFLLG